MVSTEVMSDQTRAGDGCSLVKKQPIQDANDDVETFAPVAKAA